MHRARAGAVTGALVVLANVAACSGHSTNHHATDPPGSPPVTLTPCTATTSRAAHPGRLPDLTLRCLGRGPAVDVAGIAGPAVVNLWASWCYPCRQEMPLLQKASRTDRGRVRIVGVDTNDQSGDAVKFATATVRAGYEQLSDPTGRLALALHAPGLPYTVAVDASGVIVWREAGRLSPTDIADAIHAAREKG